MEARKLELSDLDAFMCFEKFDDESVLEIATHDNILEALEDYLEHADSEEDVQNRVDMIETELSIYQKVDVSVDICDLIEPKFYNFDVDDEDIPGYSDLEAAIDKFNATHGYYEQGQIVGKLDIKDLIKEASKNVLDDCK